MNEHPTVEERGRAHTNSVLIEVQHERLRQDRKWGPQNHDSAFYFAILAEEVGEAAKEVVEETAARRKESGGLGVLVAIRARESALRAELIQTAAVAVAFVEALDRREANITERR